ncbi:MAG: hypothetical protein HOC74_29005 [Gemmatimonadetes bacterium]|jgi:hypothetical protein|nr:hypothetical protein [Gemmatimonadota bacterium]
METLNNTTRLLDRIALGALRILVVVAILAYGGVAFFAELGGFRVGNYRIAEAYTFDRISFICGETVFEAENGSLVTAMRDGEENYAVLIGDIRMDWPAAIQQWSSVPPQALRELRISFAPDDLHRLLTENRDALRKLLKYETDALDFAESARERFDWGADRFDRRFFLPRIDFFRPPPTGTMDLAILDEGVGWTLTTGPMARIEGARAAVADFGSAFSFVLLSACPLLGVLAVAAACLGHAARFAIWARSLGRDPARFARAPIFHLLAVVLVLLVAASLLVILQVI